MRVVFSLAMLWTGGFNAMAQAPEWFQTHLEFLTQDSGRWRTSNAAYKSENEPFDSYTVEWSWGPGQHTVKGRMFATAGDKASGTIWEFRLYWDAATEKAVIQQFGAGGAIAIGNVVRDGDQASKVQQTMVLPDGGSLQIGHTSKETGTRHVTDSFNITEDGRWQPSRSYTWHLLPS